MRRWRNWQTRTFEGRVGDHTGSSPVRRTRKDCFRNETVLFFYLLQFFLIVGQNDFLTRHLFRVFHESIIKHMGLIQAERLEGGIIWGIE